MEQKYIRNITTEVLSFIDTFVRSFSPNPEDWEKVRHLYRAGYCYYFAHMLKDAFRRGEVCWAAPFGHIVWMDTNDHIPYDIEGQYDGEALYFIPEKYIGHHVKDFLHLPSEEGETGASKEYLIGVMKVFCEDMGLIYNPKVEEYIN